MKYHAPRYAPLSDTAQPSAEALDLLANADAQPPEVDIDRAWIDRNGDIYVSCDGAIMVYEAITARK